MLDTFQDPNNLKNKTQTKKLSRESRFRFESRNLPLQTQRFDDKIDQKLHGVFVDKKLRVFYLEP